MCWVAGDEGFLVCGAWGVLQVILELLEIITYNPTLERVGASNRYISHGQSSSLKTSFEIELGSLDFNMVSELGYSLQLPIIQLLHTLR